MKMTVDSA